MDAIFDGDLVNYALTNMCHYSPSNRNDEMNDLNNLSQAATQDPQNIMECGDEAYITLNSPQNDIPLLQQTETLQNTKINPLYPAVGVINPMANFATDSMNMTSEKKRKSMQEDSISSLEGALDLGLLMGDGLQFDGTFVVPASYILHANKRAKHNDFDPLSQHPQRYGRSGDVFDGDSASVTLVPGHDRYRSRSPSPHRHLHYNPNQELDLMCCKDSKLDFFDIQRPKMRRSLSQQRVRSRSRTLTGLKTSHTYFDTANFDAPNFDSVNQMTCLPSCIYIQEVNVQTVDPPQRSCSHLCSHNSDRVISSDPTVTGAGGPGLTSSRTSHCSHGSARFTNTLINPYDIETGSYYAICSDGNCDNFFASDNPVIEALESQSLPQQNKILNLTANYPTKMEERKYKDIIENIQYEILTHYLPNRSKSDKQPLNSFLSCSGTNTNTSNLQLCLEHLYSENILTTYQHKSIATITTFLLADAASGNTLHKNYINIDFDMILAQKSISRHKMDYIALREFMDQNHISNFPPSTPIKEIRQEICADDSSTKEMDKLIYIDYLRVRLQYERSCKHFFTHFPFLENAAAQWQKEQRRAKAISANKVMND